MSLSREKVTWNQIAWFSVYLHDTVDHQTKLFIQSVHSNGYNAENDVVDVGHVIDLDSLLHIAGVAEPQMDIGTSIDWVTRSI